MGKAGKRRRWWKTDRVRIACEKVVCEQVVCVRKCAWVAWRWWKTDCVKGVHMRELCARELWGSVVFERVVCESCEGCVCVWEICVWESVRVSSVELVEERLCERALCERVVCERVVCEIVVWHVWPETVAPRQLRQVPCLPHRMKVDVAKRHAFTQNGRRCFQMLHLPHKQPMSPSATPATQSEGRCRQVPGLPHRIRVGASKCHTCHIKSRGANENQARHQGQPSAISATPATQSEVRCRQGP